MTAWASSSSKRCRESTAWSWSWLKGALIIWGPRLDRSQYVHGDECVSGYQHPVVRKVESDVFAGVAGRVHRERLPRNVQLRSVGEGGDLGHMGRVQTALGDDVQQEHQDAWSPQTNQDVLPCVAG